MHILTLTGLLIILLNTSGKVAAQESVAAPWYERITINGFVSTAYSFNFNKPDTGRNLFRVFDFDDNSMKLDVAELSLKKDAAQAGEAGFRIDLTAGSSIPRIARSSGLNSGDVDIHQVFVSYIAPLGSGLRIDAGKFVTAHGYEVIEGCDGFNDNYSRSFLFGYAIPFTHTGMRFGYSFSSAIAASVMILNGWDNAIDNNKSKSVCAQIIAAPMSGASLIANYILGPERDGNNADNRSLLDVIGSYAVGDIGTIAVNLDSGNEAKASADGSDTSWFGVAAYLRLNLASNLFCSVRAEMFDDKNGARTGTTQKLKSITLTPEYRPAAGFVLRAEARFDFSDQHVFQKETNSADSQTTIALNALYYF